MTKQLQSLPNLESSSTSKTPRPNFVTVPAKYTSKKHVTYLAPSQQYPVTSHQESVVQATPRSMDTVPHVTLDSPKRAKGSEGGRAGMGVPGRSRREDSRLADLGDENTPRVPHGEERTGGRGDSAMLPPIESLAPIADIGEDGQGSPQPEPKPSLKLPVASRYQLYSIGLTYNANGGKDKKERRAKKKPQTYREINSRRMKMKGSNGRDEVPDISPTSKPSPEHEQFSIRKKIDQYRNWHEEQYRQKLKDLKTDVEKEKQAEILKIAALKNKNKKPAPPIKMAHRSNSSDHLPRLPMKADHNVPAAVPEIPETTKGDVVSQHDINLDSGGKENDESKGANGAERLSSAKTWKTWRDVNDSYAYTDVKQYIKDNELMDDEKEKYINEWIDHVGETFTFKEETESKTDTKSHTTLRSVRDV